MKLRNKKTGEIVERVDITIREAGVVFNNDETYDTLAELNEEWEDYEEPKESKEPKKYWFINSGGGTASYYEEDEEPEDTEACKEIGNYFETEEEAEKAVEKLKAWKRLEDKGFRFKGINENDGSIKTGLSKGVKICDSVEFYEDMSLLFGGEE